MNESLLAFVAGIALGLMIKIFARSISGFAAFACLIAALSGIFMQRSDIALLGTFSLFGVAVLRRGRRNKYVR